MDTATAPPRTARSLIVAGLGAGTVAALLFLGWMGIAAGMSGRNFWTPERAAFRIVFDSSGLNSGAGLEIAGGLAACVAVYGALGALFALLAGNRFPRLRLALAGILFGLCWYYISSRAFWGDLAPAVLQFHGERATLAGHMLYGFLLSRFPRFEPARQTGVATPEMEPALAPAAAEPAEPDFGAPQ